MPIDHTWRINQLDVLSFAGKREHVVSMVHWSVLASDGEHTGYVYGAQAIGEPGKAFTPFDKLDPDTVLGWAKTAMGEEQVAAVEAAATAALEEAAKPKIVSPPLPWAANG